MSEQSDLTKDEHAVDVSGEESHYSIQCEDIRLISSFFRPLTDEDEKPEESQFTFIISAFVQGNTAFGHLETQVIHLAAGGSDEQSGYIIRFGLVAKFIGDAEIDAEQMGEFARLYTLSILWPYAREYAGDLLRRSGEECLSLPIINPQAVTERLMEDNLVQVEILEDGLE